MNITIRRMKIEDHEEVLSLWKSAGLPFKPNGRDSRKSIEKELQEGRCIFLVAVSEGGKIIGTVLATHDGRKGWINRLAVDPGSRRSGIARDLVRSAEKELEDSGIGITACLIEGWNDLSREVFEHLGYEEFEGVKYYTRRIRSDI